MFKDSSDRRRLSYSVVGLGLIGLFFVLSKISWEGSKNLHTLMETFAMSLAFFVGTMAIIRFYSKRDNTFLLIGVGFLGAGLLDGYHAVVTSNWFDSLWPSTPPSLIPWSWNASRIYLSILVFFSWWFWKNENTKIAIKLRNSEAFVYVLVTVLALSTFLFFAFVPLPPAYFDDLFFGRPEEFISAFLFLIAAIGYYKKGKWKTDSFEHWILVFLIISFVSEAPIMARSHRIFDTMFDAAHSLKILSYACVLIGLFANMYSLYIKVENNFTDLAHFRTMVDSSTDSFFVIRPEDGVFIDANEGACLSLGYTREELLKLNVAQIQGAPFPPGFWEEHIRILKKEGSATVETFHKRKNGKVFPVELNVKYVEQGGIGFIVAIARDIAERTVLQANKRLVALGSLAGGVAHEINNPLMIIRLSAERIRKLVANKKYEEISEHSISIENTVSRISRIVSGLKNIGRDGSKDPFEKVRVTEVLEDALSVCSEKFKNMGTKLIVEDRTRNMEFECRKVEISQIILNLLTNAFDATLECKKKWVKIEVNVFSGYLRLSVSDCGSGLDPLYEERIMEPFYSTKEMGKGTGLGLSISKSLAEGHGGMLFFDRTREDTTFVLKIPLKQEKRQSA